MTGIEILEAWYRRVWVEGDFTAVQEFFDVNALANGLMPNFAAETEDFATLIPAVQQLLRNINVSIDQSMEDGDKA